MCLLGKLNKECISKEQSWKAEIEEVEKVRDSLELAKLAHALCDLMPGSGENCDLEIVRA